MNTFFKIFRDRAKDKIVVGNDKLFDVNLWDLLLLQTINNRTDDYTSIEVAMIWFMKFICLKTCENDWYRSFVINDESHDASLCDEEYFDVRSLKAFYPVFEFEDEDLDMAKSLFGYFKSLNLYPDIFSKYDIETSKAAVVEYFGDDAKLTLNTKDEFEKYAAFDVRDCYLTVFDILFEVADSYIKRHEMIINTKKNNAIIERNEKL